MTAIPLPPPLPTGVTLDRAIVPGTEGLTTSMIRAEVERGARFVRWPYCVSIFVVTLRLSNSRFLKEGDDGFGASLSSLLTTLALGWWGIPWGPIFSLMYIWRCLRGGQDITNEVLGSLFDPAVAAEIAASRPKVSSSAPRYAILWAIALVFLSLPFIAIGAFHHSVTAAEQAELKRPGGRELAAINEFVSRSSHASRGNTEEARAVAQAVTRNMPQMIARFASETAGKHSSWYDSVSCDCEAGKDSLLIVINAPILMHLESPGREVFGQVTWQISESCVSRTCPTGRPKSILVALRKPGAYERLMVASRQPGGALPTPTVTTGSEEVAAHLRTYLAENSSGR